MAWSADDMIALVRANLILDDDNLDERDYDLLSQMVSAAVSYAEGFQNLPDGYYSGDGHSMTENTKRAVVMKASHFWESRDSAAGGMWGESAKASEQSNSAIDALLRLDRDWRV